ncbi:tyrosine-protein phosphatase non-receptor type 13 isoform X2 [Antennarius striatus]|uniref:tyrosine-protein phosphatase non-receptor type 13 isoform X2 n=1 Tax=Antennarius striatus TaxID=241820 RepID=UPI0035B0FD93
MHALSRIVPHRLSAMGAVFYLQECSDPHTNQSLRTSSQKWAIPGFSWVANKVWQTTGPHVFPESDSVCGHCSSADKDTEENEGLEEDLGQQSDSNTSPRPFCQQRGHTGEGRKFQHQTALIAGSEVHAGPIHNIKISSITGHAKSSLTTVKTFPQEPVISQVPLRLQIRASGQRGTLGISIAGGKGSLPFKNHDEGVFISRVIKGGASEKAGIHVGDRLLEVNSLNMQGATHQEAVSALRKAGSCIKLKVLRERLCDREGPRNQHDTSERQLYSRDVRDVRERGRKELMMEKTEGCLSRKIEAVVCNGNGISELESKSEAEDFRNSHSLQGRKHTMAIPRIILTHPSTSDEDVELLTQSLSREPPHDFDIYDSHVCFDNSFCPP